MSLAHAQTTPESFSDTGNDSVVMVSASAPDNVKMNSYVEIIKDASQFCITAVQEILGYAMGYECCYDADGVKRENGDTWNNGNGDSCTCVTGNIQCIHDSLSTPAPPPTSA